MQQSQVINEIDYHRAQKITEMLYHMNLITFEEYERITHENRCTFIPVLVELLPAPPLRNACRLIPRITMHGERQFKISEAIRLTKAIFSGILRETTVSTYY